MPLKEQKAFKKPKDSLKVEKKGDPTQVEVDTRRRACTCGKNKFRVISATLNAKSYHKIRCLNKGCGKLYDSLKDVPEKDKSNPISMRLKKKKVK